MNQRSLPGLVIITIILLFAGILATIFGFIITYYPPPGSNITVNGNTYYAGTLQFQQNVQNLLIIGLVLLFLGIIFLIISIYVRIKYPPRNLTINTISQSSYSDSNSQPSFIPPKNYPFPEEPEQTNSLSNTPQQSESHNNYSTQHDDSFYSDAQQLNPFSNSNKESIDSSSNSDKFCTACGSMIKQDRQYCGNCGAKL